MLKTRKYYHDRDLGVVTIYEPVDTEYLNVSYIDRITMFSVEVIENVRKDDTLLLQ